MSGETKTLQRDYDELVNTINEEGRPDSRDARMQLIVDLVWDAFNDAGISWVGFYLDHRDEPDDRRMTLGPSRNSPACSPIGLHGVCGRALTDRATQIVHDVRELGEGHIACDPRDRSEIVIPLVGADDVCWGVLDLDSHEVCSFNERDDAGLQRVLAAVGLVPDAAD